MNNWESLETTQRGNDGEKIARETIIKNYDVTILNITDKFSYKYNLYDFQTSDGIKYEVKADRISNTTHNFFIEYYAYGKPSGITISGANKWMISYKQHFFIIDTDILLDIVNKSKRVAKVKINDTLGKLIPVHDVLLYATILPF